MVEGRLRLGKTKNIFGFSLDLHYLCSRKSICTAHLSIFPSERGEELMENIHKNEKQIRYELGTRVRHQLRIIPELRFFIDDSLDYIDHIDELLKK